MKTLFFAMTLAFSLGAFASENMAPGSDRTLCAEERVNTKVNLTKESDEESSEGSALKL